MFATEVGSLSIARSTDCHTSSCVAHRKLEYHLKESTIFQKLMDRFPGVVRDAGQFTGGSVIGLHLPSEIGQYPCAH